MNNVKTSLFVMLAVLMVAAAPAAAASSAAVGESSMDHCDDVDGEVQRTICNNVETVSRICNFLLSGACPI